MVAEHLQEAERIREGIEDFRYAFTAEKRIEEALASGDGDKKKRAVAARARMKELFKEFRLERRACPEWGPAEMVAARRTLSEIIEELL